MTTIYTLGMNEGGNLQQLACPKCLSNIVKSLTIHPGTDGTDAVLPVVSAIVGKGGDDFLVALLCQAE